MHGSLDSLIFHLFSRSGGISEQSDAGLSWKTIRFIFFQKTVYVSKPVKKGIAFSDTVKVAMLVTPSKSSINKIFICLTLYYTLFFLYQMANLYFFKLLSHSQCNGRRILNN
jgi:hypothetical protein